MKSIVQRYLASNFVLPFVVSLIFFVMFLLTFQMFRFIRFMVDKTINPMLIVELIGHIAISFLPMAIPLSALFATLFTMNRLSEDSEIVSMRSFGFSKYRLFSPFLTVGILISATIFALNQVIIPHSQRDFKNGINRLTSKGLFSEIKEGRFFTEIPGVTLFAERVDGGGRVLHDVFIQNRSSDDLKQNTIFAKKGTLIKQDEDKWGRADIRLHMVNGNIIKEEGGSDRVEKIIFGDYDFPLVSSLGSDESIMKDSMRTSSEISAIIKMNTEERIAIIGTESLTRIRLEYWSRFTPSFESILFVLIGFSLGIKQSRGRGKNSGPLTLGILVGYYAVYFVGMGMAKKGTIDPIIAVFTPVAVLAIIGGWLFSRLDWVG